MADWPDADELKRVLNIDSDDWDTTVDRVLAAAIEKVQTDVGHWHVSEGEDDLVPEDVPDARLAQAALRMAELLSLRPSATPDQVDSDPTYRRLMTGHRRVFGIA